MVHAFLVCFAALGAPTATEKEDARPFHTIHAEISDLLQREAQAKELATRAAIVRRMCALHDEILQDSRYATSDTLKEYRLRLRSRLLRVQLDLKQRIARSSDRDDKQKSDDYITLASASSESLAAADSLAGSLSLLDQSQGGPSYLLGLGGPTINDDYGRDLVMLIEQTINPMFWDTNGGPGTIVYYAPLRCLVVRATSEIHGNVGGLLGGLRGAGR
jgi:hypothetical protein